MDDHVTLIPPIAEINKKLTENQRERHRLRTLLRLAVEEADERRPAPQPEAARPEAVAR